MDKKVARKLLKKELFKQEPSLATFSEVQEVNGKVDNLAIKQEQLEVKVDTVKEELKKKFAEELNYEIDPESIRGFKGDKGDNGYTPIKDIDYFDGKDGYIPIKGKDYFDGYTPVKGKDYFDGKDGVEIPGLPGKDGSPDTPDEIVEKLNTLEEVVESSVIKGLPKLEDFLKQIKKGKLLELRDIKGAPLDLRWHGGGITESVADSKYIKIDQIIPQTVINDSPTFDAGIISNGITIPDSDVLINSASYGGRFIEIGDNRTGFLQKSAIADPSQFGLGVNATGGYVFLQSNHGGSGTTYPIQFFIDTTKEYEFSGTTFNLQSNNITTSGTITGVNVTSGADPGHTHTAYLGLHAKADDSDLLDGHDTSYFQIAGSYQPLDADLSAIAALGFTSTSFLKKTATDTWALDTNTYLTSVTAHNILSTTHGDTLADSVLQGDILYGNSTPKWARLAFPATPTGKIIQATATDVAWSTNPITIGASASISNVNTGDQTITLTSDVTGSGTGSFATTIANNAVTFAKFQQIATTSLLGRATAGTGNVENLTDIPTGITIGTAYIYRAGGTDIPITDGGTGLSTMTTAYGVLCAGTTATGSLQVLNSLGNAGEVLTSNGAGALPSWQAGGGGGAPTTASYLTATAEAGLSAEVNLGALATGLLYGTVAGGVSTISSIAVTPQANADGFQITGGTTARVLSLSGADVTIVGAGTNVYAFPVAADTLVGRTSTDTFTNKTIADSTNTLGKLTMGLGSDVDGDMYYRSSNVLTRLSKGTANQVLAMNAGATGPNWVSVGSNLTVYAAGTTYSLTATDALLDFGTTDPSLTITSAGTWLLLARVRIDYNAATFAAVRTIILKLRRTNNTAADITNATTSAKTQIITALTYTMGSYVIPPVIYTTANTTDIIQIWGSIDVVPTAGSIDAVGAEIVAIRLY
jgi:hypothetical protein